MHWVNDHPYPQRSFVSKPKSQQIHSLLSEQLSKYFSHIRIEQRSVLWLAW